MAPQLYLTEWPQTSPQVPEQMPVAYPAPLLVVLPLASTDVQASVCSPVKGGSFLSQIGSHEEVPGFEAHGMCQHREHCGVAVLPQSWEDCEVQRDPAE